MHMCYSNISRSYYSRAVTIIQGQNPERSMRSNKQDALNSELRLLSRVYSIPVYITACVQCVH